MAEGEIRDSENTGVVMEWDPKNKLKNVVQKKKRKQWDVMLEYGSC